MKRKRRTGFKRQVKRSRSADDRGQTVTRLAAEGRSGDVIAALTRLNKNTLRAKHALELERGRRIAKAEAEIAMAEDEKRLSVQEAEMKAAFFAGYYDGSEWVMPDGRNILQQDRTLAESKQAWAEWLRQHRKDHHNDDA